MDVGGVISGPTVTTVSPATGGLLSGLLLTLRGSGFKSNGLTVSFGGTASLLVVVIDDNTLTAVLPALGSIGSKVVSVASADGISNQNVSFLATLT